MDLCGIKAPDRNDRSNKTDIEIRAEIIGNGSFALADTEPD